MENERCACCLKNKTELKPFGWSFYRSSGDFNGDLLCKTKRPTYPPGSLEDKIYIQHFGNCKTDEEYSTTIETIIQTYGVEWAEDIIDAALGKREDVWLCRHCIALDWDEYQIKRWQAYLLEYYPTKVADSH